MKKNSLLFMLVMIFTYMPARAEITLPYIFSSNMILQRDMEIPVWGWASPGERITVILGDNQQKTRAGKDGRWSLSLPAMQAGGPYEMTVEGSNAITYSNIMIGDVWICSGQSNMEWPVSRVNNADKEISDAEYPNIRLFTVPNKISALPLSNTYSAEWLLCTPETIPNFSAVGYFFGRELHHELNIPIGLVNTTWGGTLLESWTSPEAIARDPDFKKELEELKKISLTEENKRLEENFNTWKESVLDKDKGYAGGRYEWSAPGLDRRSWKSMELPALWEQRGLEGLDGVVWFARTFDIPADVADRGLEINLGAIDDSDMTWVNGALVGRIFNHYNWNRKYEVDPEDLKQGENLVVVRVEDYRGGGGIWGEPEQLYVKSGTHWQSLAGEWLYQVGLEEFPSEPPGTSFGPNSFPTLLFNAMIHPIVPYAVKGAIWYQGESNASRAYQYRRIFPQMIRDWRAQWGQGDFPFFFVQLANFMEPRALPMESEWAELREAQSMTLALPNTGMASTIDIGEADDIHPRNKQEAGKRLALNAFKIAYERNVVHTGPTFDTMKIEGDKVFIDFDHVGSGLEVRDPYGYLKGFAIAGSDHEFHWARAELIDINTVVVYSGKVSTPVAVRYGWADNPHDLNLYNKEGLPANPFRTDNWQGITEGKK